MPNGEQVQEGGESADWKSEDESDDDDDDSSSGEEVDSPPRSERRSKQTHDPAGGRGKVVGSSAQVLKRTRTSTPEPTEKAPKQPKVAPTMTRTAKYQSGCARYLCVRTSPPYFSFALEFLCLLPSHSST